MAANRVGAAPSANGHGPPQAEAELGRAYMNTHSDQRQAGLIGLLVLEYQARYARAVEAGGRYDVQYFMESLADDLGPELRRRGIQA
jgi:hypothetical protein